MVFNLSSSVEPIEVYEFKLLSNLKDYTPTRYEFEFSSYIDLHESKAYIIAKFKFSSYVDTPYRPIIGRLDILQRLLGDTFFKFGFSSDVDIEITNRYNVLTGDYKEFSIHNKEPIFLIAPKDKRAINVYRNSSINDYLTGKFDRYGVLGDINIEDIKDKSFFGDFLTVAIRAYSAYLTPTSVTLIYINGYISTNENRLDVKIGDNEYNLVTNYNYADIGNIYITIDKKNGDVVIYRNNIEIFRLEGIDLLNIGTLKDIYIGSGNQAILGLAIYNAIAYFKDFSKLDNLLASNRLISFNLSQEVYKNKIDRFVFISNLSDKVTNNFLCVDKKSAIQDIMILYAHHNKLYKGSIISNNMISYSSNFRILEQEKYYKAYALSQTNLEIHIKKEFFRQFYNKSISIGFVYNGVIEIVYKREYSNSVIVRKVSIDNPNRTIDYISNNTSVLDAGYSFKNVIKFGEMIGIYGGVDEDIALDNFINMFSKYSNIACLNMLNNVSLALTGNKATIIYKFSFISRCYGVVEKEYLCYSILSDKKLIDIQLYKIVKSKQELNNIVVTNSDIDLNIDTKYYNTIDNISKNNTITIKDILIMPIRDINTVSVLGLKIGNDIKNIDSGEHIILIKFFDLYLYLNKRFDDRYYFSLSYDVAGYRKDFYTSKIYEERDILGYKNIIFSRVYDKLNIDIDGVFNTILIPDLLGYSERINIIGYYNTYAEFVSVYTNISDNDLIKIDKCDNLSKFDILSNIENIDKVRFYIKQDIRGVIPKKLYPINKYSCNSLEFYKSLETDEELINNNCSLVFKGIQDRYFYKDRRDVNILSNLWQHISIKPLETFTITYDYIPNIIINNASLYLSSFAIGVIDNSVGDAVNFLTTAYINTVSYVLDNYFKTLNFKAGYASIELDKPLDVEYSNLTPDNPLYDKVSNKGTLYTISISQMPIIINNQKKYKCRVIVKNWDDGYLEVKEIIHNKGFIPIIENRCNYKDLIRNSISFIYPSKIANLSLLNSYPSVDTILKCYNKPYKFKISSNLESMKPKFRAFMLSNSVIPDTPISKNKEGIFNIFNNLTPIFYDAMNKYIYGNTYVIGVAISNYFDDLGNISYSPFNKDKDRYNKLLATIDNKILTFKLIDKFKYLTINNSYSFSIIYKYRCNISNEVGVNINETYLLDLTYYPYKELLRYISYSVDGKTFTFRYNNFGKIDTVTKTIEPINNNFALGVTFFSRKNGLHDIYIYVNDVLMLKIEKINFKLTRNKNFVLPTFRLQTKEENKKVCSREFRAFEEALGGIAYKSLCEYNDLFYSFSFKQRIYPTNTFKFYFSQKVDKINSFNFNILQYNRVYIKKYKFFIYQKIERDYKVFFVNRIKDVF